MNKKEYLKQLSEHLDKLPKKDYDDVMEHFEEYFDEAGGEGEEELIRELGDPREVATDILTKLLNDEEISDVDRTQEYEKKEQKKSDKEKSFFRYLTIAVLVILAAPIGLPLTIALIAVIFAMFAVVLSLVFALGITAFAGVLVVLKLFFVSILLFFTSPPAGFVILGSSLIAVFGTLILIIFCMSFYKLFIMGVKKIASYASMKRGEK